jgi:hypothetical protein
MERVTKTLVGEVFVLWHNPANPFHVVLCGKC